jgi:phosphotransferase system enzyme I (PtsI)
VTGGLACGPAFYVESRVPHMSEARIKPGEVRREVQRFNRALHRAKRDLQAIRKRGLRRLEGRVLEIFDAQLLMLDDRELYHQVTTAIRTDRVKAEWAYHRQVEAALAVLRKSRDEYLRQMEADISAVSRRVIQYLLGFKQVTLAELVQPSVLLAEQLSPADLVQLPRKKVLGIVTRTGSRTDHTALVARSLGIPAVVGAADDIQPQRKGQRVLVDAEEGRVIFSPGKAELEWYRAFTRQAGLRARESAVWAEREAVTADGHRVCLRANLELVNESDFALRCGAQGVGLFRTEFLFISAERLPDEAAQIEAYSELASRFAPETVVLRVYDLGGDKLFYSHRPEFEPNPAMGWRAVRLLLDRPALFKTQLSAMYKVAYRFGNVSILFPMVSSLAEWHRIKAVTQEVQDDLLAQKLSSKKHVPLGVMVEVPALALEADSVAGECDFFSVGTNDLVQYMLAVDRQNPKVAGRYQPFHPAVLRTLQHVTHSAHTHGISVSICGDLASDLLALPLLLGLGFDELSTVPGAIPQIKAVLRDFTMDEARALTRQVLSLKTGSEMITLLKATWKTWNRRSRQKGSA